MIKTYLVDDEQVIIDELLKIVDWEGSGYTVCGYANDSKTALKEIEKLRLDVKEKENEAIKLVLTELI